MERTVILLVAAMTAAVFALACDAAPRRVEVGELRTETRSVDAEGADSVRANVRIAVGELDVGAGAEDPRLLEADFAYNVAAWRPRVDYEVVGDSGELTVQQQGLDEGIPTADVRNEWDLRIDEAVPVDLVVQMGGGVGNLDLDSLALTGLNLDVGAGSTRVDLSGDWERDVRAVVRGGAGEVTMLLPDRMGVRVNAGTRLGRVNAEGLRREGEAYVNDAYGDADANLEVEITGGAGQINLQVVQEEGGEQTTAQQGAAQEQGGTTMMKDETTIMQEGTAQEETSQGGDTTMMQGGNTVQEDAAIGPSAIIEDPQRYYGQTISVGGAVGQVIEPRAFVMVDEQAVQDELPSAAELADGGVLVVRTGGPAPDVAEPQEVRVTGTLQQFDLTAFEQQQGVDLDDALYAEYQDRPVLVAAEVQPTQGEETTP